MKALQKTTTIPLIVMVLILAVQGATIPTQNAGGTAAASNGADASTTPRTL